MDDGASESPEAYNLCYQCHDREKVLDSSTFPLHRRHVIDERASCATCHNPHGSFENRALIRFGEQTLPGGVSPSILAGNEAFLSDGPGSGTCFLTCHGSDHAPKSYGVSAFDSILDSRDPRTTGRKPEIKKLDPDR